MDSLKELFKIGCGPSSSHTMGPERAAKKFKAETEGANLYIVELYGSLAATGKGHLTDWIIEETLKPTKTEIVWMPEYIHEYHTNGMKFIALDKDGKVMKEWLVFSVGGGTIMEHYQERKGAQAIYQLNSMDEIKKWCEDNQKELWEYVVECEGKEIFEFLKEIWEAMKEAVERGINTTGVLPGTLKYPRKASNFYRKARNNHSRGGFLGRIFAYTLAVSEENGGGGKVVTAPTCGACGVVPGLLYALREGLTRG